MLGREQVDMHELREICRDIVSENHRASEVIRRLRELYNRADMKLGAVNLNQLVHETLGLLRTELQLRHVTVTTELDPNLPVTNGSVVQLQQVLMNLILNATDALNGVERERTLLVRTESRAGEVRLSVADNGIGIRPDQLQRVFEPFWSTKSNGMGMGLAICQSIIAAHQGRITAMNNAEHGATFIVELPFRETAA
jgi:C4-dicarboxylate-specific signal transduction histidine kinase